MDPLDAALQSKEAGLGRAAGMFAQGAMGGGAQRQASKLFGEAGRRFGTDLMRGAAGAAGVAAVGVVGHAARKLFQAGVKRRDFQAMLENNPDLEMHQESNPKFFNAAYNSIRSLNPAYGSDPVVAGSLMRRMMQSPEGAGTILMSTLKPPMPGDQGGAQLSIEAEGGPLRYRQSL